MPVRSTSVPDAALSKNDAVSGRNPTAPETDDDRGVVNDIARPSCDPRESPNTSLHPTDTLDLVDKMRPGSLVNTLETAALLLDSTTLLGGLEGEGDAASRKSKTTRNYLRVTMCPRDCMN
jgi:hypothetical protein